MGNIYTEGFALIVGVGADLPNTQIVLENLQYCLQKVKEGDS